MTRPLGSVLAGTAIVLALVLQCMTAAAATRVPSGDQGSALVSRTASDAVVVLPSQRLPDLVNPLRTARHPAPIKVATRILSLPGAARPGTIEHGAAEPRARSHTARCRVRPPDDPPQHLFPS